MRPRVIPSPIDIGADETSAPRSPPVPTPLNRSVSFQDGDGDGVIDRAQPRSTIQFLRSETFTSSVQSSIADTLDHRYTKGTKSNEELNRFDQQRRQLTWGRDGAKFAILWTWDGTFWPVVTRSVLFWTTSGIFVAVWILQAVGQRDLFWSVEDNASLGTMLSLINWPLSISLMWYVNAAHAWLDKHWSCNGSARTRFNTLSHLARACFSKAAADRLERYCNAAHVLSYIAISSAYNYENFEEINDNEYQLLTPAEICLLEERHGPPKPAVFDNWIDKRRWQSGVWRKAGPYKQVVFWAFQVVEQEISSKRGIPGELPMEKAVLDNLVGFSENLANSPNKPVPFFFVHMVYFVSSLYLPLLSFQLTVDFSNTHLRASIALLCLSVYSTFVIGLRSVARQYADPYGHQVLDLPVLSFWKSLIATANARTEPFPDYANPVAEVHTLDKRQKFYAEQWATSVYSGDSGRHLQLRPLPRPQR